MVPGLWVTALTNILVARDMGSWVPMVFVVPPLCAMISPLIGGALADQRLAADRLFAWSSLIGSVLLATSFGVLDAGLHPIWFVVMLGIYSLATGPTWGVLTTVSLTHLSHGARQFPLVRVGATIGWVAGGLTTSFVLMADTSPLAGYAAAALRVLLGVAAFALPRTPPLGKPDGSWKSLLGFNAFSLMKQRDPCVFLVVTGLFSIPLSAFYMYGPEFLKMMGDKTPTGTMTVAQISEVIGMLLLGPILVRYRIKTVLSVALALSALRYAMSAYAGVVWEMNWHIGGIALHGLCYTLYFVTAQIFIDRRVEPGLRGQAQGLLAMVAGGLGPLVGAAVCGGLRNYYVTADGAGWDWFWGVLAAMIAVCLAIFLVFYRGQQKHA